MKRGLIFSILFLASCLSCVNAVKNKKNKDILKFCKSIGKIPKDKTLQTITYSDLKVCLCFSDKCQVTWPYKLNPGFCDKEEKAYLKIKKEWRESFNERKKEEMKFIGIMLKNKVLQNEHLSILTDKKCMPLLSSSFKATENVMAYEKEWENCNPDKRNLCDKKYKSLIQKKSKTDEAYMNYCGKKLDKIMYRVNPAYETANKKYLKYGVKQVELGEELQKCRQATL